MEPDLHEHMHNGIERAKYNAELRSAFIPVMVIIGLESLVGIIGNSMVFFVFYTRYKKCNFKYFALFLCATDLAGCLTSMPLDIVLRYYYFDVPGRMFCKIKFFFLLSILLLETFTLLIISIDRFRKICRPLSWQISNKTALRLCVLSLAIAVIGAGLITGIITGKNYEEVTHNNMTFTVTQCGSDQKYKNTAVSGISIVAEFVVIIGILVVMIVLYTFVARQLYRTKAAFDSNKGNNKTATQSSFIKANVAPARRKSIIAITLTIIFAITITLHCVFIFLIASQRINANKLTYSEWALYTLLYTTYLVNYCINPIIYGCLDHQFAKFLRDINNRIIGKRDEYSTAVDTGGASAEMGERTVKTDTSE